MYVYLNELSLDNREAIDVEEIVKFIDNSISNLSSNGFNIYTNVPEVNRLCNAWGFETQKQILVAQMLSKIEENQSTYHPYYYYYFKHSDFGLGLDIIATTSIAIAAEKIFSDQLSVILNIPISHYCNRPFLPVIISPHDAKQKDQLINIPNFNSVKDVFVYNLLYEKTKPVFSEDDYKNFIKAYYDFYKSFDFDEWQPKISVNTAQVNSFPASSHESLNRFFQNLSTSIGDYHQNSARHKQVGGIILELNGYSHNKKLSNHYRYDIYEAGKGSNKLLISIDRENGGFEMLDRSGTHIGVYGYAGQFSKKYTNQTDINSHSLLNIPESMFLF